MPQFFAFCPCVDTGCPKITRRIGTHNTKEEAVEAVCKHIMSSSYHYTEYPMAMKLACETMIEMDEEYGPIRSNREDAAVGDITVRANLCQEKIRKKRKKHPALGMGRLLGSQWTPWNNRIT